MGYQPPADVGGWALKYFVIGGAVAKPNVLQIYESKRDYEEVVVNMFQNRPIDGAAFKAYRLNFNFKLGPCQSKLYPGRRNVTYFCLKNPESKTKVLKIGSENASAVAGLRAQIAQYASPGDPKAMF
jgi:hypothetical protein